MTFTHVVNPLDSSLELRQTKVDLNAEHNRPVRLATPPRLRLRAARQGRQIRAHIAKRGELLGRPMDPLRDRVAAAVAPDLDLKHRECGQVRDFRAVFAAEDVGLLDFDTTCKDAVERVGEEFRTGRHFEQTVLAGDVLLVFGVKFAQELDTVHEFGDARGDVVVTVEADGTVSDSLGPAWCVKICLIARKMRH